MSKQEIRVWAKAERKKINISQVSEILKNKLINTNEYKNSKNIMIFYPLKDEINLLPLLNDQTKNFYLPRVNGNDLECCLYNNGDELKKSSFKTYEPACKPTDKNIIDLVIVPALACDKNNYRLGYGGGFYDRFLQDYKGIKICCVPKTLLLDTIYPEKHDIKLDKIITG